MKLRPSKAAEGKGVGHFAPLGLWTCQTADGREITLCDFASAGAHGTDYVAWLPMANVPPLPVVLMSPGEKATGVPGPILFSWDNFGLSGLTHELIVARDADLNDVVLSWAVGNARQASVTRPLAEGAYYWAVRSGRGEQTVMNQGGPRAFRVDAAAGRPFFSLGEHSLMAASRLHGNGALRHGVLDHEQALTPAEGHGGEAGGAVAFNGIDSELRFSLPFFPEEDYAFTGWVRPGDLTSAGFQQVFSAWCQGGDDPLRVTIEKGAISARIEAATGYVHTPFVPLEADTWVHVAAVKQGETLTLYLDGLPAGTVPAPARVVSGSRHIGFGFNPMLPEGEHFRGRLEDVAFFAEALTAEQVAEKVAEKAEKD